MTNDAILAATNSLGTNDFVSVNDGHLHVGMIARILWILLPEVLGLVALVAVIVWIVAAIIKKKKNSN